MTSIVLEKSFFTSLIVFNEIYDDGNAYSIFLYYFLQIIL